MPRKADLLLFNARVRTLEPSQPLATAVAIKDDRIIAAGSEDELDSLSDAKTLRIDCHGMTLIPGFHDAHCHFFALASRLQQLDCGPDNAPSIKHLIRLISHKARKTPPGQWLRAYGYDEHLLKEARHPTAADLDRATPDQPVRLDHRTGHATILNTAAMNLLGIGPAFQGPAHGVVLRGESGSPSGVFLEMTPEISRLMRPFHNPYEFKEGVRNANTLLLSKGITSIQDAGPGNNVDQWRTFRRLKRQGILTPRVTMMTGLSHASDEELRNAASMARDSVLRLGPVKVMLTSTTGVLQPTAAELTEIALHHHRKGRQLAFHAIEAEAVIAAAHAIAEARDAHPRPDPRHRIEHCAEALPEILRLVKDSGAMVVTQPGFIYHHGPKYLAQVDPGLIPHLYPLASLDSAAIPWAAGSDAPVTLPDPLLHIQAAVARRASDGRSIGPKQAVSAKRALNAWTIDAARSCFREESLGSIRPGKFADLVLLSDDPLRTPPDHIGNIQVHSTIVGGQVVREA